MLASVRDNESGYEICDVSPPAFARSCRSSPVGKQLPDALYVHISALNALPKVLCEIEQQARSCFTKREDYNLIKFSHQKGSVSYLLYSDFEHCSHPALKQSIQVNLIAQTFKKFDYTASQNPPILHRKETFIEDSHPLYETFSKLTQQEEALGLLKDAHKIGTRQQWEQRLKKNKVEIHDHVLACCCSVERASVANDPTPENISKPKIERHKAAISRTTASKPVRIAQEAGLFSPGTSFFDYGCGRGIDVRYIAELGLDSEGWDPYFRPNHPRRSADIVNLGYVINVIEHQSERREALVKAWHLSNRVLIVSAQVLVDDRSSNMIAYGDGIITSRNTFQKYYEQEELKAYIDQVLEVDAIPVALGIYFVFRDEIQAQDFRASRFRSRVTAPRVRLSVKRFEEYQVQLLPLMNFFTERGRLPKMEELETEVFQTLQDNFGTIKRAFRIVVQATDAQEWDEVSDKRRNDLLVFIALSHFSRRPKFSQLPGLVQNDIKGLFGSYKEACVAADLMLMSLGNLDMIRDRCEHNPIGKLYGRSFWIHISALENLDPLLRLYEGCASRTLGRPSEATAVKFHTDQPRITYLFYPDFDKEPHPRLKTAMRIDLRDLHVRYQDYDGENSPILHRKELLVNPDYPDYEKFAKLTVQEECWGLLDEPGQISDRFRWEKCLVEHCAELKGYRLLRRKDSDPNKLKFLKAQARSRQRKMKERST